MKLQIEDWNIQHTKDISSHLTKNIYDVVYICSDLYDHRDSWSRSYFNKIAKKIIEVKYNPNDIQIEIDSENFKIVDLCKYEIPSGKILIDSTSLSLVELIHLFQICKIKNKQFDIIYVQPSEYKEIDQSVSSYKIDKLYDLSDDGLGMQQVPPFVGPISNAYILVNLGFEGHRIGSLINSDVFQIDEESKFYCFMGIPAFKFGWENEVISTNYAQLSKIKERITFYYSGANDPIKLYDLIESIYSSAEYERRNLCLVPLGTKPSTIAFALFAINHPRILLMYDFVKKKTSRSKGAELVHIWRVQISN
ncbi:hypothetical protein [Neisseria shayeganii]|uniref:Uncharacterized protein n=1 Tax=Neisseria shayeganii 871 TaxID=1032488 RepID=G4CG03_9NEIS|nr:hypothetical protein [Neisseria shayeganii]EGY53244.1 hypothetical protein HMPREF9371_0542 [Neisseria shayeganii 871]